MALSMMTFRPGGKARKTLCGSLTLADGTVATVIPFSRVDACLVTENNATSGGEVLTWSYAAATRTLTIDSDSGSSTATVSVLVIGY